MYKSTAMKAVWLLLSYLARADAKVESQTESISINAVDMDSAPARQLSFQRIVNYEPRSQVTDIAALDLDQKVLEEELFLGHMKKAQIVYTQGGHSRSFASVKIKHTNAAFIKGTIVYAPSATGKEVTGVLMETVQWPKGNETEKIVKIAYQTSDVQSQYVGCQVGGLYELQMANRDGCFKSQGEMTFQTDSSVSLPKLQYAYDVRLDNNNARTLQRLSTMATDSMRIGRCTSDICPYMPDFQKFVNYYGDADYGNNWVTSAFANSTTDFSSGLGNVDFTMLTFNVGRAEAISKGSAYMIVLMEVIRELEDAITDCERRCDPTECNEAQYYSIDAAAALYTGSLEKGDGLDTGKFLYYLADRRCIDFMTCGENSNKNTGISRTNLQVIREMEKAQLGLLQNQCNVARTSKETIVNYIKVPLVQSVLQFAFVRQYQNPTVADIAEQVEAEGATFTAALLPWIHACNSQHASDIYNQMKIGSKASDVNFKKLKASLESIYPCLGITCGDVGGIHTVNGYHKGAEPCNDGTVIAPQPKEEESASTNGAKGGKVFGALVGSVCAVLLAVIAVRRRRARKRNRNTNKRFSNIAAVAEIA
ncbi:hypothetical protein MPSEU_000491200 [Mayamaea pseudoterrestris]|nr:hypothetical protein MPSEU_000491200 [Mayamaea pseudoterrestris]